MSSSAELSLDSEIKELETRLAVLKARKASLNTPDPELDRACAFSSLLSNHFASPLR
jgi:hypothetical protein